MKRSVLLVMSGLLAASCCKAQETIIVTYSPRPPYHTPAPDGSPVGLTGTPAAAAFQAAGIAVTWAILPTNRQLAMVKDRRARSCSIGWFRTPGRERYAKFTKPIYRDKAWLVLARADYNVPDGVTLELMLQSPAAHLLVKDNFSYGPEIDAMLARLRPSTAVSTGGTEQMLQSLRAGAADFLFISEDEGGYLMAQGGERAKRFKLLRPGGMPRGEERHIMCGMSVPDEVIAQLNKAITFK
ncbi:transporter substrate-binding domain-containing protein [Pseudoduganella namucuonensis]|uniref:Uncharacterized protein n=1 Tax=Pseudoduganella namucuonensis TaxID=1035707 RepID=A0A1I7IAK3_9BURK|nr:transporter substrate-binding domain-containing protein [Pseudoduganella namucuonensis]SFU69969.1 conserved hypothetical protein [Pseudoduganella namucuonensis]